MEACGNDAYESGTGFSSYQVWLPEMFKFFEGVNMHCLPFLGQLPSLSEGTVSQYLQYKSE